LGVFEGWDELDGCVEEGIGGQSGDGGGGDHLRGGEDRRGEDRRGEDRRGEDRRGEDRRGDGWVVRRAAGKNVEADQ